MKNSVSVTFRPEVLARLRVIAEKTLVSPATYLRLLFGQRLQELDSRESEE